MAVQEKLLWIEAELASLRDQGLYIDIRTIESPKERG